MILTLHDTMTGEKRPFVPNDPKRVTMYVCGPTVYNYSHIGNFRPVVAFDLLFRVLRHIYGPDAVVYAANITDVDDKINAKAAQEGVPIGEITSRYLEAYHADSAALGALPPTFEPRATQTIDAIVAMIGRLINNGAAYAAEGHVLFNTQAYGGYGQLSGRSMDDMIAGARVEVAPYKRHPADFVLWKPSKPGEPEWPSPWGAGRPGWHIECSAMIEQTLGLPIDIHGGGIDLIFPHHENERAQGLCADHATGYSNYWLHNGFLTFGDEKMSKSLGNVVLAHDLLVKAPGEVVRWALLSGHYRQPLDWTGELLAQAEKSLDRLYGVLQNANALLRGGDFDSQTWDREQIEPKLDVVYEALFDDLNTPRAFAALFGLADQLRALLPTATARGELNLVGIYRDALVRAGAIMGFLQADPDAWFEGAADDDLKAKVDGLLKARFEARQAKDWATADRIRDELNALNIVVMDGPDGATWRLREAT
jgi:cysteinyl-tRNA synthetase